ncbi:thiamine pyrophosphate-binding protein [Butyrivibrio sp. AE3006]|uniref:thiamine pyrophosphate-binding protein n=1 Tax=Butyrivibrio sp. AE3006 TaxID=1280673 RepID=UPI00041109AC|nr:thiamine pyrophosphate-binding protein [Butyrivibrio sp. AE3006]
MKVSDYIVDYLIEKGIKDVFGYPGGMVTHLMESFSKRADRIEAHVSYHEQGAAFAACGYAQESGNVGVAYATSGPGATNLITGICDAYFDSIPTLFITGQVNSNELKGELGVRQRGFQETDIVSMVSGVTKYAKQIQDANQIKYELDYAFHIAMCGRRGPVLLDIPMNIFRSEINEDELEGFSIDEQVVKSDSVDQIIEALDNAKAPVILIGNGVKTSDMTDHISEIVNEIGAPIVTSMIAFDAITDSRYNYGFIGAYGSRVANFLVAKSDLVISFGSRLDIRQVGKTRKNFAPNAKIIRVDIDTGELEYSVHEDEIQVTADLKHLIPEIRSALKSRDYKKRFDGWIKIADEIKMELLGIDDRLPNKLIEAISRHIPDNTSITTDVGQNQVWVAQSFELKTNQKVFFSGGHGAMGYALPAAIGSCIAKSGKVFCFTGDGGLQMNVQELMVVAREKLPVKIFLMNNQALGMIRHFQEMYFNSNYFQTVPDGGFVSPNFEFIAKAYGIKYCQVSSLEDVEKIPKSIFEDNQPAFVDVRISEDTYVFPKLEFGKPNQDQEPLLDRALYNKIMDMSVNTYEEV